MKEIDLKRIDTIIRFALKEDIGSGDITSNAVIPEGTSIDAVILARQDGVVCGAGIAERVFAAVDPQVRYRPMVTDGEFMSPGKEIAFVEGNARSILKAERTAINFLGLLSGVATRTREMVEAVKGTGARILDTRKTIPLHRYLEKYAVTVGGGENHRIGLWDMVLMKDNHIRAYLGGKAGKASSDVIGEMVKKARRVVQKNIKVEIEVETLKECETALGVKPDIIMLDNMPPETVKKAVELRRSMGLEGKVLFEVSGGITIDNVKSYAETGVDVISSGSLTSSVRTSDFSLEVILKDGKVPAGNRP